MAALHHTSLGQGVAVVGGGLVGSLLAIFLKKRHNLDVTIFERGADMRRAAGYAGRSINLVLTSRGLDALAQVGLAQTILNITVPVYGRIIHSQTGTTSVQPYGPDDTYCNYSVSRGELNKALLNAAEECGVQTVFDWGCDHLDTATQTMYNYSFIGGRAVQRSVQAKLVFGTDGAGSRCRQAVFGEAVRHQVPNADDRCLPLGVSYKELFMPAVVGAAGARDYPLDARYLHIWPRGEHFMMALPNKEGSFTMTLYLPDQGPVSFAAFNTPAKVLDYFTTYYPDAVPLMPTFSEDFQKNPTGFLGTLRAWPWTSLDCSTVLLGDASHAITPFFGQGCNAGFEDVVALDRFIARDGLSSTALQAYARARKEHCDAIGDMAVENFSEMGAKSGDPVFQLHKQIEVVLARQFPLYCSRYALITHSLVPYAVCREIGTVQQTILEKLASMLPAPAAAPAAPTPEPAVDLAAAAQLIDEHLVPALQRLGLSSEDFFWRVPAQ